MRIDLLGWSSEGLRSPDMEVDLRNDNGAPARVALVQMPNGTGKTTTLELLNAALNHTAKDWSPDEIRQFRRRGDTRPLGSFLVKLLVDNRPLTFELTLDFENGTARYRTTKVGSGGIVEGWEPPPEARRFLSPEFLRLFIFDGEFADDLFDPRKAEADRAIDALCQLYLLDEIADFAQDEWELKSKSGPKTDAGLSRYRNDQARLLKRREELRLLETKAAKELATSSSAAAVLEGKISQHLSSMAATRDEHTQAHQQLGDAQRELHAATAATMTALRMPLSIHPKFQKALIELKENLDQLKLPENTSAQFFEELMREDECICGRQMTEGARAEIMTRSKRYLDAEESGIINALKSDIEKFAGKQGGEALDEKLSEQLKTLGIARRKEQEAEQLVRTLKRKLIEAGDEQLQAWQSELEEHQGKCRELGALLEDIRGDRKPDFSLKLVEKELEEVGEKVAEITQTVTLHKQTTALKDMLSRAAKLARGKIKEELVQEANEKIQHVLINDPLEIERIDQYVRLAGQDKASVGQTLSVGYTFLMSVLHRGNNDFPLVVDSPANPIDADVRRNIGAIIPGLCTQFVGFTINTEREGFVPALEAACDDIKFLTLFRITPGTERLMAGLPKDGVTRSENAILVEHRGYFMDFGIQSEEEA